MTLFLSPFVGNSMRFLRIYPQIVGVDSSHTPQNMLPRFHPNLQSFKSDFELWLLHYGGFFRLVWLLISVLKNLFVTLLMPYHLNSSFKIYMFHRSFKTLELKDTAFSFLAKFPHALDILLITSNQGMNMLTQPLKIHAPALRAALIKSVISRGINKHFFLCLLHCIANHPTIIMLTPPPPLPSDRSS